MSREDEFFDEADDPALKAALRRALGRESAPPELRQRVESMLALPVTAAAGKAAASTRAPLRWPAWLGQSPAKSLIAAAIAFIAIGFMFHQVMNFLDYPHHKQQYVTPRVDFPVSVAQDLVKAHDQTRSDQLKPTADAAATAVKLTQTEGFNVAALDNAAGWQFKGAQEVSIGDKKGAQLVYANASKDQLASIFSVSAADRCGGGDSNVYRGTLNGHPVSGFVQGGIVYAVVVSPTSPGGSAASQADVDALVSQVQSCISAGGMCSSSATTHATTTHVTTSP